MTRLNRPTALGFACDSCGQLPHPAKARLTLANVAAMLPIELVVHAAVVNTALPYLLKVVVLTLTATILVIWVAEPSVRLALRGWLHAPALRHRRRLHESAALWRIRLFLDAGTEGREELAVAVRGVEADIITSRSHRTRDGELNELVVAAPDHVTHAELLSAAGAGGGREVQAWPETALAVADSQTRALALALRVAEDPAELQFAIAELLEAEPAENPDNFVGGRPGPTALDGTLLKVPAPWHEPLRFSRPGKPFTPAESARAHRLAELAEFTELKRKHSASLPA